MAGTIVCDVISDGAGNSTATDNAIYGSAKAWVNFSASSTPSIRASYNVSSITYNTTGQFKVNFTNALTDANYAPVGSCSYAGGTIDTVITLNYYAGAALAPTASAFGFTMDSPTVGAQNPSYVMFAVFR